MTATFEEHLGYRPGSLYSETRAQSTRSAAYELIRQVKIGEGLLFGFSVYNSKGSAQFVQVFDKGSIPVTGDVPECVFTMAASSNFGANWIPGRLFRQGCWVANSSTGPTYTAGSADCFFDVQFL